MSSMCPDLSFELCASDRSMKPPAKFLENPVWESIDLAIGKVFSSGGFLCLKIIHSKQGFIKEICMKALPSQYRLTISTRSSDSKLEIQEWWEPGQLPFRGFIRFGDDDWDARTVCSDISVAMEIFREFFEFGDIPKNFSQMRSQWDPRP